MPASIRLRHTSPELKDAAEMTALAGGSKIIWTSAPRAPTVTKWLSTSGDVNTMRQFYTLSRGAQLAGGYFGSSLVEAIKKATKSIRKLVDKYIPKHIQKAGFVFALLLAFIVLAVLTQRRPTAAQGAMASSLLQKVQPTTPPSMSKALTVWTPPSVAPPPMSKALVVWNPQSPVSMLEPKHFILRAFWSVFGHSATDGWPIIQDILLGTGSVITTVTAIVTGNPRVVVALLASAAFSSLVHKVFEYIRASPVEKHERRRHRRAAQDDDFSMFG